MSSTMREIGAAAERQERFSPEEWELRVKLAATYRIFHHLGWHMVVFNHITTRVPGDEHHFLINPFGLRYDEVTASNLVKIDLDGNPVGVAEHGVNYAGFVIHSAIHQAVPAALWIMHTHTKEGIAVSCKKSGLTNTNFYSAIIWEHVAYHDFEGLAFRADERPRLVASLGDASILVLRNHGLLTHGRTVEEAFMRLWIAQLACETQLLSQSMAGEDIPVTPEATANSTRDAALFAETPQCGGELFAALQRIVDVQDPSYRL